MLKRLFAWFPKKKKQIKDDILSWITVALALIPEAVAFAFVAWVSPLISLQTAIVIGIVAALLTWRPWMISSSTAAIAIVIAPLVAQYSLDYLFATVVLIWVIQLVLGFFKTWKYTSIIPYSVVLWFLNWLAIVIFLAQFDQFMVKETVIINWIETMQQTRLPLIDLWIMWLFVLITMWIIQRFPKITKAIPSTLVAIWSITIVSVVLSYFDIYALRTVQDFAWEALSWSLPSFGIPNIPRNRETLRIIFPYALVAALVWLTEATLTLKVLDDMTDTKWKMNKEYIAQWAANVLNWFLWGMWWDAMIWQSIINIKSGWRTKLSGLVAACALLFFLLFAAPVVNAIPLASLVWLMFMVVISTFERETLKYKGKVPTKDIAVIAVVSFVTIFFDLATAVILWVLLAALIFAREKGKAISMTSSEQKDQKTYNIHWLIFFGSIENFKSLFDVQSDPKNIVLDLQHAKVMDFSAMEALDSLVKRYKKADKKVTITNAWENCLALMNSATTIRKLPIKK